MKQPDATFFRSELEERRSQLMTVHTLGNAGGEIGHLLREVDMALERIERGTFGLCEECHDPIETDRLLANPLLRMCLDHLTHVERRALEDDIKLASRIQGSLLPPRQARWGPWEAAYHYQPAGLTGGDYCDLQECENGFFVMMGDISGKGIAASLLMSNLHAICRSLLSVGMSPIALMQAANRLFCQHTMSSHYATLLCAAAGPSGEVTMVNAGHCPAVLVGQSGVQPVGAAGLPIGLFCEAKYEAQSLRLRPGDSLVFYTDGLTEAPGTGSEEYGLERLLEVADGTWSKPPAQLVQHVVSSWTGFRNGAPQADDLAVLALTLRS